MSTDILRGSLVRLVVENAQTLAEPYSRWSQDSEFWRLMDSTIARQVSVKAFQDSLEKFLEKEPPEKEIIFNIRLLEGDLLIGDVDLGIVSWAQREAFVGIAIGERAYWGKGCGTDAMRLILRYGFQELNLRRISLNTFSYNPRAIRSYEKVGFLHEGQVRGGLLRDGRRYDILYMGILRDEWVRKEAL